MKNSHTAKTYGFLWNKERKNGRLPAGHHYDKMQEVAPFSITTGKLGLEGGCGNGYDLHILATRHPDVDFVGLDLSDGIYNAGKNCKDMKNVHFVKASLTDLPFKNDVFDFAYSYGAIHHTPEPEGCFAEMERALKNGSRLTVYLYEKHEKNPFKYHALFIVKLIRIGTTRIPKKILYALCFMLSPVVYAVFSLPAKIFSHFEKTKNFCDKIPFNFAEGPFSLAGDLYDRFGAPIEYRYTREETEGLFKKAHFKDVNVTKIKDIAGWVAWGTKKK